MFRFYKTILTLKTRSQEQNLKKKYFYFFHYHLSLFSCSKTKLKIKLIFYSMSLFKQNEYFYRVKFFFNRIKCYERGYKYLLWIHNFIWKKKIFTEKNKIFVKIIHTFYLKNVIIFRIVLLHLINHNQHLIWSTLRY